ncbi:MAG: YMGG-like glycine zipper-containing protein [Candidatus Methylacidiphilales bacterium]
MPNYLLRGLGATLLGFILASCGSSGSGTPTKTGVGTVAGAAAGAAIGQAVGGSDGWWIGAATGAAVGGAAGYTWGRATEGDLKGQRLPYGIKKGGQVQSPYSDYQVNLGGRVPGEAILDPNVQKYFLIP